jgi:hypothetical protein
MWFLPARFISPGLWNYSRQVYEFASGLEQQGNRLFCSSDEVLYWENKAYMHRKLAEIGARTPETRVLTSTTWEAVGFDMEPVLIKETNVESSSRRRRCWQWQWRPLRGPPAPAIGSASHGARQRPLCLRARAERQEYSLSS